VDPSATVTTRSKAFSLDRVLLPEMRRKTTSTAYASTPTTSVRSRASQPPKNIRSMRPLRVDRRLSADYDPGEELRAVERRRDCDRPNDVGGDEDSSGRN